MPYSTPQLSPLSDTLCVALTRKKSGRRARQPPETPNLRAKPASRCRPPAGRCTEPWGGQGCSGRRAGLQHQGRSRVRLQAQPDLSRAHLMTSATAERTKSGS